MFSSTVAHLTSLFVLKYHIRNTIKKVLVLSLTVLTLYVLCVYVTAEIMKQFDINGWEETPLHGVPIFHSLHD